jgi:thiamine biosynthesis lipoprotein
MLNRRDFLASRPLANAAGQVLGALDDLTELAETLSDEAPPPETLLFRASRRAMAATFEVALPFATPDALLAAEAALDLVDHLEAQLTVYRDDSDVSNLNRLAGAQLVHVDEVLFELLRLAARLTEETQGAFDVTAGTLVKAWGFFRGPRRVPQPEERAAALRTVGMCHVLLDPEHRTVRFLLPELEINLGSIGKGYALDCAARLLRDEWHVRAGLLHAGHSSVYAMGTEPATAEGWRVALRHPWNEDRRLGVLTLKDRALGTSAATFQYLEHFGRKLGHILDPRTGWPAQGIASASVTAPTAAEADALATAFFILGVGPAREYCLRHPEIGAVLVPEGEQAVPVVLGLAVFEFEPATVGNFGKKV